MQQTAEPYVPWVWVIYDHPKDHPESFVVRPQYMEITDSGQEEWHFGDAVFAKDLEEARALLPFRMGVHFPRHPADDPVIVESWMP